MNVGKRVNSSFDLAEWGEGLKAMPMQVLWSAGWSHEWSQEGDRVANALPQASFVTHTGGRWAQVRSRFVFALALALCCNEEIV